MSTTATDYQMTFGKHEGRTLFQIACEDPTYLDWAADGLKGHARFMVREALKHPDIERRVNAALEDKW